MSLARRRSVSTTVDAGNYARAIEITGITAPSELIDLALARLIDAEVDRQLVEAYTRVPQASGVVDEITDFSHLAVLD